MKLHVINSGSKGNCYFLTNEKETLIIEAGVNISEVKKALNFNFDTVVGCLVSHSHKDHSVSVGKLAEIGVDVFASKDTFEAIRGALNHHFRTIEPKKQFKIGGFSVLPFDVKHDVPCLGFLIEHEESGKVLFLTDTYYCKYTFKGLNNIIIESNYSEEIINRTLGGDMKFLRDRIYNSHFSLENCKGLLKSNNLKQVNNIVLIHLSEGNANAGLFKKEIQELTKKTVHVAEKGMTIEFNKTPF